MTFTLQYKLRVGHSFTFGMSTSNQVLAGILNNT